MEKLLEDLSFTVPDLLEKQVRIDREYVQDKLSQIIVNPDLTYLFYKRS